MKLKSPITKKDPKIPRNSTTPTKQLFWSIPLARGLLTGGKMGDTYDKYLCVSQVNVQSSEYMSLFCHSSVSKFQPQWLGTTTNGEFFVVLVKMMMMKSILLLGIIMTSSYGNKMRRKNNNGNAFILHTKI